VVTTRPRCRAPSRPNLWYSSQLLSLHMEVLSPSTFHWHPINPIRVANVPWWQMGHCAASPTLKTPNPLWQRTLLAKAWQWEFWHVPSTFSPRHAIRHGGLVWVGLLDAQMVLSADKPSMCSRFCEKALTCKKVYLQFRIVTEGML
jgi:hypothetical protein